MVNSKVYKLNTKDMEEDDFIEVEEDICKMMITVKHMIEDVPDVEEIIPLITVNRDIFHIVLDCCRIELNNSELNEVEKENYMLEFLSNIDQQTLFEVILASNFLDIPKLLDNSCQLVANMIKSKTPEEIRTLFNIKNDFTPEEEEQIRRENEWCEER